MKVAVTGATGFIGTEIVAALRARGDQVVALSRDAARARRALGDDVETVTADLEAPGPWRDALAGCAAVVHLAGEPLAGRRWDTRFKQIITDSRVEGTRGLVEAIAALPAAQRPRVLVSSSGIDYYGFADGPSGFDDDDITERDPMGDSFLGRLCKNWEAEASLAEPHGVRVVRMRTGLVLGPGGALAKMTGPFRFFIGGKLGSGKQWVSWIHRDDVVAAYLAALDDPRWTGPVNLVAPESTRASEMARALGAVLHRPSWMPVPGFAIRAAVGELAEYLLNGRKAIPKALTTFGFSFKYPTLRPALAASLPQA